MARRSPKPYPFSEPTEDYTKTPNEYYDVYLKLLSPNENKVLQCIIRKTWGWRKAFDAISHSQFMKFTGIKSKNTVKKAIASLLQIYGGLILQYETGTGFQRKTYYWLKTEKNYQIYQGIISGRWTVEEAYALTSPPPPDTSKVIPIGQKDGGSKTDPQDGSNFDPCARGSHGSKNDPTKKNSTKKREKKDGDPLLKNVDKTSEADADAVERFREQHHVRRRRAEDPPGVFAPMGELVDQLLGSFPLPEPRQ